MKYLKLTIITCLLILMAMPAFSQRRKQIKDASALLTSVKIHMRANPPRFDDALELLDEVLASNGPVAEAFFSRGNIYGEFAIGDYDPHKKLEWVGKMIIDFDSLQYTCDNKDIKKKFRKKCDEFIDRSDSVRVFFWRENYKEGIGIIHNIDNVHKANVAQAIDSASEAAAKATLDAAADSAITYFRVAYAVDHDSYEPIEGIGIVFNRMGNYDSSAYYFGESFKVCPDSLKGDQAQNSAYAYLNAGDWENSIEWLRMSHNFIPEELSIISNISIAFNRLEMYDSALAYNRKALEINPADDGANYDIATYWLVKSQDLNNEMNSLPRDDANKAKFDSLSGLMNNYLDTSAAYFKVAATLDPTKTQNLEQYATVSMIAGNLDDALDGFQKVVAINPSKEVYISIGDILIQKGSFADSIEPYEKALEFDQDDVRLLEVLIDLYESNGKPDKAKTAKAQLEKVKG